MGVVKKAFFKTVKYLMTRKKMSPFALGRGAGRVLNKPFFNRYMNRAMADIPEDHHDIMKEYLY